MFTRNNCLYLSVQQLNACSPSPVQVETVPAHWDTEFHGLGEGGYQRCGICGQKGTWVVAEAYCCDAKAIPDRYCWTTVK
jgi:hypothetical protein